MWIIGSGQKERRRRIVDEVEAKDIFSSEEIPVQEN